MTEEEQGSRRRRTTALAVSGAAAAAVLVLGVTGTLSSWTTAIITNDTNNVATQGAVILKETDGSHTCYSSDGDQAVVNSSSCTTVNSYSSSGSPLVPGTPQVSDITFTNVGSAPASSISLAWGSCSQSPVKGGGTPPAADLCAGELTVALSCSTGATYNSTSAWTDLAAVATKPGSLTGTLTHTAPLASGASFTCEFTAALPGTASVLDQGITVTQPLTWTLTK